LLALPGESVVAVKDAQAVPVIRDHPPRIVPAKNVRALVALAADHFAGDSPLIEIGAISGEGVGTIRLVLVPHAPTARREPLDAGIDHPFGRKL
jgi:hypothetical protein